MKLRTDLLEFLTGQDILEEALANVDRYNAEPSFPKTGKGYLRPATPKERAQEIARSEALAKRLEERMKKARRLQNLENTALLKRDALDLSARPPDADRNELPRTGEKIWTNAIN